MAIIKGKKGKKQQDKPENTIQPTEPIKPVEPKVENQPKVDEKPKTEDVKKQNKPYVQTLQDFLY